MNLGLHYHLPVHLKDGKLYTYGYFGVFIDSLAAEVDNLYCFLHHAIPHELVAMDYQLQSDNVIWVDLGPHNQLYYRLLKSPFYYYKIKKYGGAIDALLIRTPTPLVQTMAAAIGYKKTNVLLVGDYEEGSRTLAFGKIKNWLLRLYGKQYNNSLKKLLPAVHVIANSKHLQEKFAEIKTNIKVITTTTLSKKSFYVKEKYIIKQPIQLLYTGRIDLGKGLLDILDAMSLLKMRGIETVLSIAGWDDDKNQRTIRIIKEKANSLNISDKVIFLGRKQIGEELNLVYRNADFYLMCSQVIEGFPRTIWEAMANSLPVIATKVGSMPHFLKHRESAFLIEPMQMNALADAIECLFNDDMQRNILIKNGYKLALDNTLEGQAKKLIESIKSFICYAD